MLGYHPMTMSTAPLDRLIGPDEEARVPRAGDDRDERSPVGNGKCRLEAHGS